EGDAEQHEVAPECVHDREVDRALQRSELTDLEPRQREGGDARELEPHEEVEEIAAQREAAERGAAHEEEHVEELRCLLHERARVEERAEHDPARERRHRRAERIELEGDPDREPAARMPAAEPVRRGVPAALERERDAEGTRGAGRDESDRILDDARHDPVGRDDQGGSEQRHRDRQRQDRAHPCSSRSSSGSIVPDCFCTSSASARMRASTVTLTTMSVSASDWTTGSTAVVPSFTPLKIGGPPPFT